MESLTLTLPAALMAGLAFGAGPCNVTCLPYLGPVFVADHGGIPRGWRTVLPFSLGRLFGYGLLGGIAGGFGYAATQALDGGGHWVLGLATAVAGLLLLRRSPRACPAMPVQTHVVTMGPQQQQQPQRRWWPALFAMGTGMALNPCLPLGTVLTGAAATGQTGEGALLGLSFGIGAVVIPTLLFSTLVAHFGAELRANLGPLQSAAGTASGSALVMIGLMTAAGFMQR